VQKEEILTIIRGCSEQLGHPPCLGELKAAANVRIRTIRRLFGSYSNALREAGLRPRRNSRTPLETLFLDWAGLARKLGKIPTIIEYESYAEYSSGPLMKRFQRWGNVPRGMYQYADRAGVKEEWADVLEMIRTGYDLQAKTEPITVPAMRSITSPTTSPFTDMAKAVDTMGLILEDRPMYGAPLRLPGLAHAPINEMGVVYLFGTVAAELGFWVTRLQSEFPDCEAMRRVDQERWQRVRIEFEFESRNFLMHGHDPKQCDIIVCWTNNWPDCPLQVIELKSVLAQMGM
jgi:hypothetical protein